MALSRAASAAVLLMQFFCNRAAAFGVLPSKCSCQADAIELRGADQLHNWFLALALIAAIIDVDKRWNAIRRRAPPNALCSLAGPLSQAARIAPGVTPARQTYVRV